MRPEVVQYAVWWKNLQYKNLVRRSLWSWPMEDLNHHKIPDKKSHVTFPLSPTHCPPPSICSVTRLHIKVGQRPINWDKDSFNAKYCIKLAKRMDPYRGSRFMDNEESEADWTQCVAFSIKFRVPTPSLPLIKKTIEVRSEYGAVYIFHKIEQKLFSFK